MSKDGTSNKRFVSIRTLVKKLDVSECTDITDRSRTPLTLAVCHKGCFPRIINLRNLADIVCY